MQLCCRSIAVAGIFALSACQASVMSPEVRSGGFMMKSDQASSGIAEGSLLVWNGVPGYPVNPPPSNKRPTLATFAPGVSGDVAPASVYPLVAQPVPPLKGGLFWAGPINSMAGGTQPTSIGLYTPKGTKVRTLSPSSPTTRGFIGVALDPERNLYVMQGATLQGVADPCLSRHNVLLRFAHQGSADSATPFLRFPESTIFACVVPMAFGKDRFAIGLSDDKFGNGPGVIKEYALTRTGQPRLTLSITLPNDGSGFDVNVIGGLAIDRDGNLFALVNNTLFEYPWASNKAQPILPGLVISAFTLDSSEDIYASVQLTPSTDKQSASYAIEEFAPGASTPMRSISGVKTKITSPGSIALVD